MSMTLTQGGRMAGRLLLVTVTLMMLPAWASAQPDDPELHAEAVKTPTDKPEEDETVWTVNAGGVLNTGNTQSWMLTAGSRLRLVRGQHALSSEVLFNYGQANLPDEPGGYQDTARNLNARSRYDYFLTERNALFVANVLRWDTFAGLNPRVQGQAGYLRTLFKDDSHRFWGEVGYDYTYDNFYLEDVVDPDVEGSRMIHSARLFLGYEARFNEMVGFLTGAELLMSVTNPEVTRFNWESTLTSKLFERLAAELKFMLRYDNVPAPERQRLDTLTQISLVATLM
jgi:putative salt-induced outer membrane protein YdiY